MIWSRARLHLNGGDTRQVGTSREPTALSVLNWRGTVVARVRDACLVCSVRCIARKLPMLALFVYGALILYLVAICGRCTAKFAVKKGRSRNVWFVLGALFFPLPSIALALLPSRTQARP